MREHLKKNHFNTLLPEQQYWEALGELITHRYYLEGYLQKHFTLQSCVKAFFSTIGASSLGAWIVFNQSPAIWCCIIVLMQVATAVINHSSHAGVLKKVSAAAREYKEYQLFSEGIWYQIENCKLTPSQIEKEKINLSNKIGKTLLTHFSNGNLPSAPKLMEKAKKQSHQYLQLNFQHPQSNKNQQWHTPI